MLVFGNKIASKHLGTIKASTDGFSLLELITILAVLTLLTTIASTTFKNIFNDLENDEAQAYLNSMASECLKLYQENIKTTQKIPLPSDVVASNQIKKYNYE